MVGARLANITLGQFVGNQHVPSANLQTPPVSQAAAAELVNVSVRSIASAAKVEAEGVPELVRAVAIPQKIAELAGAWALLRNGRLIG
jgi:hypothetical protein